MSMMMYSTLLNAQNDNNKDSRSEYL